jgi:hypothetical protein
MFADVDRVTRTDLSSRQLSGGLFSVCKFYPTESNPDPKKKIDDGDHTVGTLWVTIQACTGAKAHGIAGARKIGVKMEYAKGKYHTGTKRPLPGELHDRKELQRPKQTKTAWAEDFVVQVIDLTLPLRFSVRDYSFARTRKLANASLNLQQDVLNKLPKEGGRLDCDVRVEKVHSGKGVRNFCFGVPFEDDGAISVTLTWEPGELFLQAQEREPARRVTSAVELMAMFGGGTQREAVEGGACLQQPAGEREGAARRSPPVQPEMEAAHPRNAEGKQAALEEMRKPLDFDTYDPPGQGCSYEEAERTRLAHLAILEEEEAQRAYEEKLRAQRHSLATALDRTSVAAASKLVFSDIPKRSPPSLPSAPVQAAVKNAAVVPLVAKRSIIRIELTDTAHLCATAKSLSPSEHSRFMV